MTTYATARHSRVIEFTPEGRIVSVHASSSAPPTPLRVVVGEGTRNLAPYVEGLRPKLRRSDADPARTSRSFASVGSTGEQPLIGLDPDATAVLDELQARFNEYATGDPEYVGRHHRPGPLARLARALRLGRRDGV